jgi:hypothetical protein
MTMNEMSKIHFKQLYLVFASEFICSDFRFAFRSAVGSLAVALHTAVAVFHPDRPYPAAHRPLELRIQERQVAVVADTTLAVLEEGRPLAVLEDDRPQAFRELDRLQVRLAGRLQERLAYRHLVGSHPQHQEACPAGRAEVVLHRQRRLAGRRLAGMHQPVGRGEDI